ncbi:tautomerase family protein [Rosenbergiella epipactidis]|uniref:tautomerase family protein n=1 Tax=Rosenbergiella epipactidis TaxID=1544694 RepID=UPI002025E9B8|nr:tautomerase family protein [Rosenbergiella epipactidis]MCL9668528.1 tautomerase family protein [Rosenbergiella epipactidis]
MPLLKFDLIQGRSKDEIRSLLDAAHDAMVEAFQVPESDRYQVVTQHQPEELIIEDTGLGYSRSEQVVLLTVVSRARPQEQKIKFYSLLAENFEKRCKLSSKDLIVSITENTDCDWSFGGGRAQFITGELK